MGKAPNILFVMADQLAPQVLPAYGGKVVKSPHLDRLAADGAVFENAYCNFPLCAPSRMSMLSGRLPSRVGAFDNAAEFPAAVPTFVHHLRVMGYRTCLAGKMHYVGPDQLHGYEERLTTDIYPSDFQWTANWRWPESAWVPWYHSMRAVLDAGPWRRSVNVKYDDEVAYEASRWIHDYADGPDRRPFFLTVSFISPHDPYLAPPEHWRRYEGVHVAPPQVSDVPLAERDAHSRRLYFATGRHLEEVTPENVQRARRAYYAVTSYVDDKLGALLAALEQTGLLADTIVVFTSDHGDMLGERGLFFKMSFFEWSARVPLIVFAPERWPARRIDANVSLVDLFPTFLELGAAAAPEPVGAVDGHSLCKLLAGEDSGWPNVVYAEYTAEGASAPVFMVRRGRFKYVYCDHDPPLLFDLNADPHELENLCAGASHRDALASLRAEVLSRWDPVGLAARVAESQLTRLFIQRSLRTGRHTSWDYQPHRDAGTEYFRSETDVQDAYEVDSSSGSTPGTR